MRNLSLCVNGVLINPTKTSSKNNLAIKNPNNSIEFERALICENVILSDEDSFKKSNSGVAAVCYNLGKFVKNNPNIMEEIAIGYIRWENKENANYVRSARTDNPGDIPKYILQGPFYCLNVESVNEVALSESTIIKSKYIDDKKLKDLLIKWIKECGISNEDCYSVRTTGILPIPSLLHILDLSLYIYNFFQDSLNGNLKPYVVRLTYIFEPINGKYIPQKCVDNLVDLVLMLSISYYRDDYKSLRCCEYCNDFFFGRSNKKCCSSRCKDRKNQKYERRKYRIKNDTKTQR